MSRRFKPIRRLRNELFSLFVVALVPVALCLSFPRAALRPLPAAPSAPVAATCAFVTLRPETACAALAAARAAWQLDGGSARQLRIDLFTDSLPAVAPHAVLGFSVPSADDWRALGPFVPELLPPTFAAPPPVMLSPQADADAAVPAFPREELLKLN